MSDEKPKKKRFEGLIQFKEALRQIVVCLQASMESRFMTAIQSELVKKLDESTSGSHHLLFAMGSESAKPIESETQLEPRHLLTQITQTQGEDVRSEIKWSQSHMTKASVWIDSSDILMANFFFWLISVACRPNKTFHLQDCVNWGGAVFSKTITRANDIDVCLQDWQQRFQLSYARQVLMNDFTKASVELLKESTQLSLLSDGSFVGLLIEGRRADCSAEELCKKLQALTQIEAHSITLNLANSADGITQILMLSPIRESNKSLNVASLRGFIVLENMRPAYAPSLDQETSQRSA